MARFAASLLAAFIVLSILEVGTETGFAHVAPLLTLPPTSDFKLAARKKHHRESAEKREKRAQCKAQAEKLLSDSERRDYMKECMSQ
jgi:hypothetical protein